MCNECKKLLELYAETQLECLRKNKSITKSMVFCCDKCKQYVTVPLEISDEKIFFNKE